MNPASGYFIDRPTSTRGESVPATSALPPYEPTLGDSHDTQPGEDVPRVVPELSPVQKIIAQQVELPAELPEDN